MSYKSNVGWAALGALALFLIFKGSERFRRYVANLGQRSSSGAP